MVMKAIQIEAFGNPAEVMKLVDVPDVGAPGEGEVVIALEASPINMSDLLMISGRYGYRPKLPAIVGTEGVGRIVAVGSGVTHLKAGDRTVVPYPSAAWAERIKADARVLRPLGAGDVNQLAMLSINPATAWLLLTEFVTLQPGDWIIHNSANSGVGRALIGIAKSLGLKTVNVVRRDDVVADIKAIGGDVVLVDGPDLAKRVASETGKAPTRACMCSTAPSAASRWSLRRNRLFFAIFQSAVSGWPIGSRPPRRTRSPRCMIA
jgi:NADPH:quinone reductase-like Zn-dependent oxidoreductase